MSPSSARPQAIIRPTSTALSIRFSRCSATRNCLKPNGSRSSAGFKHSWSGKGNTSHKRKGGNESDEQPHEQTEKAPSPAFTQAGKHRAVPFALCDVALLDAVLCG